MSSINDRISMCIEKSGLNKTAFAKRLGITQPFVSKLCSGASQPSDRTISDICREFNVNETWLRTGEGDMFKPVNRDQEIADFMADILKGDSDFCAKLISIMARLSEDEWAMLEKRARELAAALAETPEEDEPGPDISELL